MNSRFRIIAGLALVIFMGSLLIMAAVMLGVSSAVLRSYSRPGEPKYAYMDHMYDKGAHQDQLLCDQDNNCVVLTTMGAHMFVLPSIELDGRQYSNKQDRISEFSSVTQGIYCMGSVDLDQCFRISTLSPDSNCAERVKYMGFNTYLFKGSCLRIK